MMSAGEIPPGSRFVGAIPPVVAAGGGAVAAAKIVLCACITAPANLVAMVAVSKSGIIAPAFWAPPRDVGRRWAVPISCGIRAQMGPRLGRFRALLATRIGRVIEHGVLSKTHPRDRRQRGRKGCDRNHASRARLPGHCRRRRTIDAGDTA